VCRKCVSVTITLPGPSVCALCRCGESAGPFEAGNFCRDKGVAAYLLDRLLECGSQNAATAACSACTDKASAVCLHAECDLQLFCDRHRVMHAKDGHDVGIVVPGFDAGDWRRICACAEVFFSGLSHCPACHSVLSAACQRCPGLFCNSGDDCALSAAAHCAAHCADGHELMLSMKEASVTAKRTLVEAD
jgi:hypothetical protein